MSPSSLLLEAVLGALLGRGRKRSGKARRFLTPRRGSLWSNPGTLMTAAGVAWGVYETLQRAGAARASDGRAAADRPTADPGHSAGAEGATLPPPLDSPPAPIEVDAAALRLVRLAISAAAADGALNEHERSVILQQARAGGVADVLERELANPRPVREVAAGATGPEEAGTMYVLAYTILRADEQVTPTERIYLAQLATLLGLDQHTVEALERDTGERIDALGDQGQPGG